MRRILGTDQVIAGEVMETTVEVQANGAVVLPAAVREQYQIRAGDRLRLVDIDGVFILA